MCIYIHTYIFIYLYMYHLYVYVYIYVYVCIYIHIQAMHIHMRHEPPPITPNIPYIQINKYLYILVNTYIHIQVRNERPPITPNIPKELVKIIEGCWHPMPQQRPMFGDMKTWFRDLAKVICVWCVLYGGKSGFRHETLVP